MKKVIILSALVSLLSAEQFSKSLTTVGWHNVGVPITDVNVTTNTFSDNISIVWQWDSNAQSWKFYSKNTTLLSVADDLNVPIITTLTKGDAIWVKNNSISSINFANSITSNTTSCTEQPQDIDTRVLKIGTAGQELSEESTGWSAILYKDPGLHIMLAFERTPATFLSTKNWTEANNYCENLNFIGFNDWRLPSKEEGQAMTYYNKTNEAKIKNITSGNLWSSSIDSDSKHYTYYQDYSYSYSFSDSFNMQYQCVRTAQ